MARRCLLDTNIFIAAMKGQAAVRQYLERTPLADLWLSPLVLAELELGVAKSQHRDKNAERLARVTSSMELAPIGVDVCRHYADIRAGLERRGCPIGANDYWIAAQARALGAVLVTDNVSEFSRVSNLVIENWLA